MQGIVHDNVVHAKKRVKINGKFVWKAPTYVKVTSHRIPGRKTPLKTKAGTQIIDRAWHFMKDRITLNQHTQAGGRLIRNKVRSAQYLYWMRGNDLWVQRRHLTYRCQRAMHDFVCPPVGMSQ